jgi:transcriptional regulator with XRE-family HTH domain
MTSDEHAQHLARRTAPAQQHARTSQSYVDVGAAVRSLRTARGLSIRALAAQSGLAVNTLSLIEHGKTSPSVSTLQQLATALQVPITAFFEEITPAEALVVTRAAQRPRATFDHGFLEELGAGLHQCAAQPFLVTLAPGASSGSGLIAHAGHEFAFCLASRITYTIHQQEVQEVVLSQGDSLFFAAHQPHRWENQTATEAQMLLMFCPTADPHQSSSPPVLHRDACLLVSQHKVS